MHPSMREYDLVVIGSGPGGQKAAIAAAKHGKSRRRRCRETERAAALVGGSPHLVQCRVRSRVQVRRAFSAKMPRSLLSGLN
jgi:pyruvate/2-oxoglutarate dehydrogenase complex dihydrolipoamide dehydrogenase (E3) component